MDDGAGEMWGGEDAGGDLGGCGCQGDVGARCQGVWWDARVGGIQMQMEVRRVCRCRGEV